MKKIILFGSGYMANEYLKVLKVLSAEVIVIGRDEDKAKALADEYGYVGYGKGVSALEKIKVNEVDWVINAALVDSLAEINKACLNVGLHKILIEKPGALNLSELKDVLSHSKDDGEFLRIAFNRRFYNSVRKLEEKVVADEGALGCFFDFTDREKDILQNPWSEKVVNRWGWCNALHVIDTAFFLIGEPEEITVLKDGGFDCHTSGSSYAGCGKTKQCLFSYFATWSGGGRWNIEISTKEGRYKLSPVESLVFCRKNQFSWENILLDDQDDEKYKPGLYKMVKSIVFDEDLSQLPSLKDQISMCKLSDRIFGYEN
ncbi:Gfo/Idh/MocA family oxidoreductase [Candidatus Pacearchaeota archaeon]|nr:Gfo/Idh/MocA family oxidoreductase [Candidatus Pacearchaeota archaeon]